jgi:hypothetical protein
MAQAYDAVIVEAGHNGLTCACYLARAGLRTLVLDQYHTVGGLATTEEITLPGFRSDMHAFGFQLANLSPVPEELGLAEHGLELLRPEINYSQVFPDGGIISMHRDLDDTVASIGRYSLKDGEKWRRPAADFVQAKDEIAVWMNTPPESLLQETEQFVRQPGGFDAYRAGLQTYRSWANEHFEREETRLFIGGWACHVSMGPRRRGRRPHGVDVRGASARRRQSGGEGRHAPSSARACGVSAGAWRRDSHPRARRQDPGRARPRDRRAFDQRRDNRARGRQAANKKLKGDKLQEAADKQDWDASVKALVTAPNVLSMMNDQLDWTTDLCNAVLAQQADVMDAIQRLRAKAQENGKLATTKQQTVSVAQQEGKEVIVIEPASPETVYVPYYEPQVVYGTWPYPDYPPYYFPPAPG